MKSKNYSPFLIYSFLVIFLSSVPQISLSQEMPASAIVPAAVAASNSTLGLLDLKDMDVLDVFKLISTKSGYNIVASKEVRGRVTVYLKDVRLEEALHMIMESNGWAYVKEDDIFKVMTDKEFESKFGFKFGQKLETRVHHLTHVNPADVAAVLNQVKGASAKVVTDDKSGTIILVDEPHKLDELEAIIEKIDVPVTMRVFKLSYGNAENISNRITEILTPGLGTIKFDERLNTIIVSDTERAMTKIENLVNAFDLKDKEVLI